MKDYYADSSALVKRHISEAGSQRFLAIVQDPTATIITAHMSLVEMISAIQRRYREAFLSLQDVKTLTTDIEGLFQTDYQVLTLTPHIVTRATLLLASYPLRAYDSVQLASALLANDALQALGLPQITFLSGDRRLLGAATAEGLICIDVSVN